MLFSAILTTHNDEPYIAETIDSLIGQTIGFQDHFQLIIVDDGSTDQTGKICRQYADQYPENIEYIYQDKAGTATARNAGLARAEGKYINFIDADVRWKKDAFEKLLPFLEEHDDVDVTACRIVLFENQSQYAHDLNYKFKKNKVVEIEQDYSFIQLSLCSAILKREAISEVQFHEDAAVPDNLFFINRLIMQRGSYAVFRDAVCECRRKTVLADKAAFHKDNKAWYDPAILERRNELLALSAEKYGSVIPYVQYLLAYDSRKRFANPIPENILSKDEKEDYIKGLHLIMDQVGEQFICELKDTALPLKACMLQFRSSISEESKQYILDHARVLLDIVIEENGHLHIEGRDRSELFGGGHSVTIRGNDGTFPLEYYTAPHLDVKSIEGVTLFEGRLFRVDLPLKSGERYEFRITDSDGKDLRTMGMGFGRYSRLTKVENSYFKAGHCLVTSDGKGISIIDADSETAKNMEDAFAEALRKSCLESVYRIRKRAEALCEGKPILLVVDRGDRAGDNAEALFKYMCSKRIRKNYRIYFSVSKESPDFARLSKYGEVVDYGSEEYLALFLAADMLISSQWAQWLLSPFGPDQGYVRDMIKHKFIFLQHGTLFGDISSWGCRQRRNISTFVTASKGEYESIVGNEAYGYDQDHVVLTGFARNDYLIDRREKLIVFAPTWRKYMDLEATAGSYKLKEEQDFGKTDYCIFYNRLINDERLLNAMREKGYRGLFCIHPLFSNNRNAFHGNEIIKLAEPDFSYNEVICKSALMITDFSSVVADHAYMKKPVVYCQFDKDLFFASHTWGEGYFDYEKSGFGPVVYTYEDAVDVITNLVMADCPEDRKYAKRVDRFFAYTDHKNCKRICKEIGL